MSHSVNAPAFLIGSAGMTFIERLGNYEITEIEQEKSPMSIGDAWESFDKEYKSMSVFLITPRGEKVSFQ